MEQFENARIYQQFGAYIKQYRLRNKLLQGEIAKKVGVTQAYYHYIEKGSRKISFDLVLTICSVLGLDINEFLLSLTKKKPQVIRPEDEEKEEGAL